MKINVGSKCYEHVHPQLYGVYDFSYWTLAHPGNVDAIKNGNPNPITNFANSGTTELSFPGWHSMNNWDTNYEYLTLIGKLGQDIDFISLPTSLQTPEMATELGATSMISPDDPTFEACGSPFEVKNDPSKGHRTVFYTSTKEAKR